MSLGGKLSGLWPGLRREVLLNRVASSVLMPVPLRRRFLAAYGMRVGKATIYPGVWFGSSRVSIGDGTFINQGCMFNTSGPITIGERCSIAMNVTFVTSSHGVGGPEQRAGEATTAPIVVGDGTWIGANAVILPGVTIGAGSIIAAGAVVVSDCEADAVYGGVPARKIRGLLPS